MKKILLLPILILTLSFALSAQQKKIDSLKSVIKTLPDDTIKIQALFNLSSAYQYFNPDTAIIIGNEAYNLASALKNERMQAQCLNVLGITYVNLGDYGKAMQNFFKDVDVYEKLNDAYGVIRTNNNIGSTYNQKGEYQKALLYINRGLKQYNAYIAAHKNVAVKYKKIYVYLLENYGQSDIFLHQADTARQYFNQAIALAKEIGFHDIDLSFQNDLGTVAAEKGDKNVALKYFEDGLNIAIAQNDVSDIDYNYFSIAKLFQKFHQPDSAIYYAQKELASAQKGNFQQDVLDVTKILYKLYDEKKDIPQAYKYYKLATKVSDSLFSQEKVRELLSLDFEEQQRKNEIAAAKLEFANKVRGYLFAGGFAVVLLLAIIFWRNGMQRKKANELLGEQKEEIQVQRDNLGLALEELKITQSQLVQREKMASLGELTAGVAHEIQNPLNFVNNFSEVNEEMLEELKAESEKPNAERDWQLESALINDLVDNQRKIKHHGKRADSIVKGMLEHSRAGTGQKQPTDLNTLADEYLRLAYHGLRAKDKDFNASLITHFDSGLAKANVVPQDISRVLLNLFNNAFYAVNQKQRTSAADYKPEVTVTTVIEKGSIYIKVKDNGNGIPDSIKDKIMQPFFTTKPTGEGTGLGLSLSYDIVVKGHGGTINVETNEGEYTEFTVTLPLTNLP